MFCGINWDKGALVTAGFEAFQYFTVDSNVLMGIVAIVFIAYELLLLKGKTKVIPKAIYIIKLAGTVGVALTFFTVVFYLAPLYMNYGYSYFSMFVNANLFLHALCPIFAMVAWIFFEHTDSIRYPQSFLGIIPMAIYAVYYVANALSRMDADGKVPFAYDWYGFAAGGVASAFLSLALMLALTSLLSFLLTLANRKINIFKIS